MTTTIETEPGTGYVTSTKTRPFKIDKFGNVTDRATGQHLGYIVDTEYMDGYMVSFNHFPIQAGDEDGEAAWNAYIEEVGLPPYREFCFRTRLIAANFLWETREYDRREFPPPSFTRPTWDDQRGTWVGGDGEMYSYWRQARDEVKTSFVKVDTEAGERWAVHGLAADLAPGTSVEVRRRSGIVSTVELEDVVRSTVSYFGTTFVTVLVKKTPHKKGGNSGYRRRTSMYGRSQCPGCGEDRGGMWNGYRCDECGYRR